MLRGINRKKPKKFSGDGLTKILMDACHRRVLAKISSSDLKFTANFLDYNRLYLLLENNLSHLDDVRQLRRQSLTLYFPFRNTLLKGQVRLMGLTTHKNIRALRLSVPDFLVTDEKRDIKRVYHIPRDASLTFNTVDLRLFHGKILDVSACGMAFTIQEKVEDYQSVFKKGVQVQAEAFLGHDLKLSFDAEIRYVTPLDKMGTPGSFKFGVRMLGLKRDAQESLNHWLFTISAEEVESEREALRLQTKSEKEPFRERERSGILVISPRQTDLEFWYQCLGRKYEIITSDGNIANIRVALGTGPALLLVYLDAQNPARASFTRKLCSSLVLRFPIMFFGEESDPKRQKTLMGEIRNRGFLDASERRVLSKFRVVDEVMADIQGNR